MKASLESLRRSQIVWPVSALVLVSVLIIAIFAVPPAARACTDETAHRSVTAMPPCMHRVTVTSKPCGATIYIDSIEVGRTPMSFPMPTGRYTLILHAPGHQQYAQRILVPNAPLKIEASLVPEN